MPDRRTLQRWSYALVGVAGGIAFVSLPQLLFPGPPPVGDAAFTFARMASAAMALAWGGGFSLLAFRKADEFNRERSKFAWYWGAGGAMALTLAALGLYMAADAPWLAEALRGGWKPIELIALGAFGMGAAQVVGFAAAGVLWWQVRR